MLQSKLPKRLLRRRGKKPRRLSGDVSLWFLLPSLLGVGLFVLLPFADVIRRSFMSAMGGKFVGISNYKSIFGNDAFLLAAGNTGRFLGVCIPLLLLLSLIVATILYDRPRVAAVFKTSFLLPMAIPVASIVFVWQILFAGRGVINGTMVALGSPAIPFMDSDKAFYVLVGSYIWKNLGYNVLLWMAGLGSISQSLYEAARVDGAGWWRMFFHITLPLLLPTLYTIAVLSVINAFKVFREAYLVAGDYPHSSIYQVQHLFNNWFRSLDMDKLAAASVVVAAVVLVFILLLQKLFEEENEH